MGTAVPELNFIPPSTIESVSKSYRRISIQRTYANAHQEAHHIRLLLLLKFLDIYRKLVLSVGLRRFSARTLEGTHL